MEAVAGSQPHAGLPFPSPVPILPAFPPPPQTLGNGPAGALEACWIGAEAVAPAQRQHSLLSWGVANAEAWHACCTALHLPWMLPRELSAPSHLPLPPLLSKME